MAKVVSYWESQSYKIVVPDDCPTESVNDVQGYYADKGKEYSLFLQKEERMDCGIADVWQDDKLNYLLKEFKCRLCGEKKYHAECDDMDTSICYNCARTRDGG